MKRAACTAAMLGLAAAMVPAADGPSAPPRLRRADSFVGIHFDFHAGRDCTNVGARTTRAMVETVIAKVKPDYIQIDCKGHPGYSSYPTKVGNPAPGFVGDPLRVWRDVTREHGVALFMHYSGVWDGDAVTRHPDWAAIQADGKPNARATSVFGPYVDELMIPQLKELAGVYGVDGVWVDGDCWGATPDYGAKVVAAFRKATGAAAAPRKPGEPMWNEWLDFNREGYRRYLRHYVDAMKAAHPAFETISNWAFSDHMPEPVSADVAALSGDFSPQDSVNSARFSGRCLERQGKPWDLMSWSFRRTSRRQKSAVQLEQEAAVVLALGGGYQAYFKMDRDGAIHPDEMDVMGEVARFCRERRAFCHRSQAVPQVAIVYSRAGHYRSSNKLFHPSGGDGLGVLRPALQELLGAQQSVEVLSEHHLAGRMRDWPLIVVPGWGFLEPAFRDELAAYAKAGGRLLLIGPGPARLFAGELGLAEGAAPQSALEVACGAGRVGWVAKPGTEAVALAKRLFPSPMVEVAGSPDVDVCVRRLGGRLMIDLVNAGGPHADTKTDLIEAIPPVGPLTVSVRLPREPKAIVLQPGGTPLKAAWAGGLATVIVPQVGMLSVLSVEE